jgi:hypothetical protein
VDDSEEDVEAEDGGLVRYTQLKTNICVPCERNTKIAQAKSYYYLFIPTEPAVEPSTAPGTRLRHHDAVRVPHGARLLPIERVDPQTRTPIG